MLQSLSPIIDWIKKSPKTSGALSASVLTLLILRRVHYKYVVFPNQGGRKNSENSPQLQHPNNRGMLSQDIQIKTSDNLTLKGWYIKKDNAKYLTVYYHQNAGNIGTRLFFIQSLMKNVDTNVLIIAYRGFSDSDGLENPKEQNIKDDSKFILEKARELAERDNLLLFVFGRSLGGFAAISTLSQLNQNKPKGLILENTFTSVYDVAANTVPIVMGPILWPLFLLITFGSYNSMKKIGKVNVPTLFVKGDNDKLIPKVQMDSLQKQQQKHYQGFVKEYVVEGGGHNDTWYIGGSNYYRQINEFYSQCARI